MTGIQSVEWVTSLWTSGEKYVHISSVKACVASVNAISIASKDQH
jgi:hypothetical protein